MNVLVDKSNSLYISQPQYIWSTFLILITKNIAISKKSRIVVRLRNCSQHYYKISRKIPTKFQNIFYRVCWLQYKWRNKESINLGEVKSLRKTFLYFLFIFYIIFVNFFRWTKSSFLDLVLQNYSLFIVLLKGINKKWTIY